MADRKDAARTALAADVARANAASDDARTRDGAGTPEQGGPTETEPSAKRPSMSRRGFVLGAVGGCAMLALGTVSLAPQRSLVRPPGTTDDAAFFGTCLRCAKCMEACPNGVIVPTHLEDGLVSMRTPKMNYSLADSQLRGKAGWCDHCEAENGGVARCISVCPSGALDLSHDLPFEQMKLGVAKITTDWCLAWRLKGCTICKNACPLDAISFDDHNRPIVDESQCNGCGKCEQACVSLESVSLGEGSETRSMDARAITVHPLGE